MKSDAIKISLAAWYGWHHVPCILQSSLGWLKFLRSELAAPTLGELATLKRGAYEAICAVISQRESA